MTGAVHGTAILEFPTYRITVREPLRDCVYQEVQDRQRAIEHAKAAPATPNLDWKVEFDKACTAFDTKAVLVLVGDRQPVSLDETITLTTGMEVAFLRLVPLVGGLSTLQAINEEKAKLLYDCLDGSAYWKPCANKDSRSIMNITWRLGTEELETKFCKEATAAGLEGLKGHRSVGGIRASIYNAVSKESVAALVGFMNEFEKKNG